MLVDGVDVIGADDSTKASNKSVARSCTASDSPAYPLPDHVSALGEHANGNHGEMCEVHTGGDPLTIRVEVLQEVRYGLGYAADVRPILQELFTAYVAFLEQCLRHALCTACALALGHESGEGLYVELFHHAERVRLHPLRQLLYDVVLEGSRKCAYHRL